MLSSLEQRAKDLEEQEATEDRKLSLADAGGPVHDLVSSRAPPIEWVIPGFLPSDVAGLLVAPGGTGKGFFVLSLAVAVSAGRHFLAWMPPRSHGSVLILAGEETRDDVHRRLEAICQELTDDERAQVGRRLHVYALHGRSCELLRSTSDTLVFETELVGQLVEIAGGIRDLRLIALDPFARFHGLNENDAAAMTRAVELLERIQETTGATVLATHHSNKSAMRDAGGSEQYASRGSSALTDGVRWQTNLRLMTEAEAKVYGIDPDQRSSFVHAYVTKRNGIPYVAPEWLQRVAGGALEPVELAPVRDVKAAEIFEEIVDDVVGKVRSEAEAGREYSPRAFEDEFGGVHGIFGVGAKRLRGVIHQALDRGKLVRAEPSGDRDARTREVLAVPARGRF